MSGKKLEYEIDKGESMKIKVDSIYHLLNHLNNCDKFTIPLFQRDYVWTVEEVEWLLNDFKEFSDNFKNNNKKFQLGQFVFCEQNDGYFVLDGQQRITTIFLVYLLFEKIVQEELNKIRKSEEYDDSKVEKVNEIAVNLKTSLFYSKSIDDDKPKIEREYEHPSGGYYLDLVHKIKNKSIEELKEGKKETLDKICSCITYFICSQFGENECAKLDNIIDFGNFLKQSIIGIYIIMPNINTGNDIFESINAKGRRLNNLDLLKNLLCKRLENKLEQFDISWNKLVDNLIYDKENNLFLEPNTFLCDYIYARYGEKLSKEKVYSYLRKKTNDFSEKEVVEFVEEIGEMAKLISTIKSIDNYKSDLWSILMLDVLNVKQMTPIIMVCSKMENEYLKNEVLKSFFNLSFLKVVHGGIKDKHRIEGIVKRHLERGNNTLVGFTKEESNNIIEDIQKIIEEYKNEYNNSPEIWLDEKYSNKSAASIIYTIERTAFYTEDNNSLPTNKFEKNKMEKVYSAEHIIAKKFDDEKNKAKAEQSYVANGNFTDYEQLTSSISRLGNYTILSKRLNSNLGDTSLKNKREHYKIQSQFYITRILCEDLGKENSKKLKVNRRIKDSSSILFVEDFSKKDDVTYEMIEERTRNLLDIIFKIMLEKSKNILG